MLPSAEAPPRGRWENPDGGNVVVEPQIEIPFQKMPVLDAPQENSPVTDKPSPLQAERRQVQMVVWLRWGLEW